jgi:hypothetical protein
MPQAKHETAPLALDIAFALFGIFQFEICLGIGHWDLELETG